MTPAISWRTHLSRLALVILGVSTALGAIELGMRSAGAAIRLAQRHRNQQALGRKHEVRILCLGESTTAGEDGHGRYPEMLEEILNRQGVGVRFAVVNQGRIGATTNEIIAGLAGDLDEVGPDLVVAMMGINDGGKTHAYGSIIAPGAPHWYGSFRVYKLYRLIRFALERKLNPTEEEDPLLAPRAAGQPPARWAREEPGADASPFPPVPEEVQEQLREAAQLIDRREYQDAESIVGNVLREHTDVPKAYVELARIYRDTGRPEQAHHLLERGRNAVSSPSVGLYHALGWSYFERGHPEAAIHVYRFIIDSLVGQLWDQIYYRVVLADIYEETGQLDLAEQTLIEIVDNIDPWNDINYQHLIEFYERHGKHQRAAERRDAQLRIRHEHVNPTTRRNFHTLRDTLQARGIPLIAVQYPGRRLEPLQRVLDNDPGLLYVDTGFFKEIEERDGYDTLYVDRFAGDFGHLTETGNRLLARSVARVIVEELYGQPFDAGREARLR